MTSRTPVSPAGRRGPAAGGPARLLKRVIVGLVALVLLWLALAVLVINPLLNGLAPRFYRDATGGTLQFDELFLNPLDFSLRASNLADRRPDGSSLWRVARLRIDPAAVSLVRRAVVLDEVTVEGIAADLRQTAPDRWNIQALLGEPAADAAPQTAPDADAEADADESTLPWIEIRELRLGLERLAVAAPYLAEPVAVTVQGANLAVRDFTTASGAASRHHLSWTTLGAGPTGLAIDRIDFSLGSDDPVATHLDGIALYLDHLALAGADGQPFALALSDAAGGRLYWQGDVAPTTQHASGQLTLQAIDLAPVWHLLRQRSGLEIASGSADLRFDYRLDWRDEFRAQLDNGAVTLRQPTLSGGAVPDTGAALAEVAVRGISLDSARRSVAIGRVTLTRPQLRGWNEETEVSLLQLLPAATEEEAAEPAAPWSLALAELRLRDGRIDWRASQLAEPLRLRGLELRVDNFSWPAQQPAQLALNARLNDATAIAAEGSLDATRLDGDLRGTVSALPLGLANPTVAALLPVAIDSGSLDLTWEATLAGGELTRLTTSGALVDVKLQRTDQDRRLVAWQRLAWRDARVEPGKATARLGELSLVEPWFRFEIEADGTTNLSDLTPHAAAADPAPADAAGAPAAPAAVPTAETAGSEETPAWAFALDRLRIENGTLIFADRSLLWPFRARIQGFTGGVRGLSSDTARPAQVDLRGNLADYAPVTLAGTAAPLAKPPQVDLGLTFSDVDLALLSPYSRTYAGYAIDGGLITVELAYRLEAERIRGSNRVVIRQLTLGEQVESPKAVDLPIRLALALLTDRRGVIDLNVDVSGDLGDPQFGLGKVVRRAFFNAIARVATSPFRLLGRLAGVSDKTAEQLDHFDFEPGAPALRDGEADKVGALQRALLERPTLRLHVIGHIDPARDEPALRSELLAEQLLQAGLPEAALAARDDDWAEAIADLHAERFPAADAELTVEAREQALLDALPVPPARLQALALRRAQTLKQALITGAAPLPASRVFIDANPGRRDDVVAPRATLRLEG